MEEVGEGEGKTGKGGGEWESENPGEVGEEESEEESDVDAMVKPTEVPPARSTGAGELWILSSSMNMKLPTWASREIWSGERGELQEPKQGKRQCILKEGGE